MPAVWRIATPLGTGCVPASNPSASRPRHPAPAGCPHGRRLGAASSVAWKGNSRQTPAAAPTLRTCPPGRRPRGRAGPLGKDAGQLRSHPPRPPKLPASQHVGGALGHLGVGLAATARPLPLPSEPVPRAAHHGGGQDRLGGGIRGNFRGIAPRPLPMAAHGDADLGRRAKSPGRGRRQLRPLRPRRLAHGDDDLGRRAKSPGRGFHGHRSLLGVRGGVGGSVAVPAYFAIP
jgi:hypothetical protein